jgi:hypothetical protein
MAENLVCKRFLSRDGNIGRDPSPQISLMKAVKLRNNEGSSLLLLSNTIVGIAPRTSPRPRLCLVDMAVHGTFLFFLGKACKAP